jgi:hypothetical protein
MREFVDAALEWLAIILTILLGLLGAWVTLFPPLTDEAKYVCLGIFALFSFGAALAIRGEQVATKRTHARLLKEVTGGDTYCYFSAAMNCRDTNGKYPLLMNANGPMQGVNYWISPAAAKLDRTDPLYVSIDRRKFAPLVVHQGDGRMWDGALSPGEYIVEFEAINGLRHWVEYLTIAESEEERIISVRIEHVATGKTIKEGTSSLDVKRS